MMVIFSIGVQSYIESADVKVVIFQGQEGSIDLHYIYNPKV